MRGIFSVLVSSSVILAYAQNLHAEDILDKTEQFDIAPGALDVALVEFSKQASVPVSTNGAMVRQFRASGIRGQQSAKAALTQLLAESGLTFRVVQSTVQVAPSDHRLTATSDQDSSVRVPASRQVERSGATAGRDAAVIDEVIVTAQKRGEERLQDVPVPVSVLAATSLLENGGTRLDDYFSKIPGVSLVSGVGGTNTVLIRGVATNGVNDNPTVGIAVDDAPFGATTFLGGGLQPIDMDPNELSQIEVLRGPQGTLYGASSIGGLIRYVMMDPSLDEISGRGMVSAQSPRNSADDRLGYGLRGSINLPVSSSLAVRVSGFDRHETGYIDDTFSGSRGINDGRFYGGRAALLWRANEEWTLRLGAVRQLLRTDAANVVDLDPSEQERLESSDYIHNSSGANRSVSFLTGTINGRISDIDIVSISAYASSDSTTREGLTRGVFLQFVDPAADAGLYANTQAVSKFSQEFRANVPIGESIDWLVGAFYTSEKGDFLEGISSGLRTGEIVRNSDVYSTTFSADYAEIAAFTNVTVRFTDRFDMQFGGRLSENRQELSQMVSGVIAGGGPFFQGPVRSTDDPFTYLITPRFKLTNDWMIYSRIASGYRPGGPTFNSAITGGPRSLKADTTENYEVGLKGNVLDGMLSIDASTYYIDWKDIPTLVILPNAAIGSLVNAGGAVSKGIELSLHLRPFQGLTLSAWGAWVDAYIDELPANSTAPFEEGDRLPYSPRFSGNASIEYDHPLSPTVRGNVGASMNYVGDRSFRTGSASNVLTAYSQVDAHAGLKLGTWTVNAFVNNITDERGRVGLKALSDAVPTAVTIIRPRTIGLSIAADF